MTHKSRKGRPQLGHDDHFVEMVLTFAGERASLQAKMDYDLKHNLWDEPLWNKRARTHAANKAYKLAQQQWLDRNV